MDYNTDRSNKVHMETVPKEREFETYLNDPYYLSFEESEKEAKIYIETLTPWVGYGGGEYSLSDVQEIMGSSNILAFLGANKTCQNEKPSSKCAEDFFIETCRSKCKCMPLSIPAQTMVR